MMRFRTRKSRDFLRPGDGGRRPDAESPYGDRVKRRLASARAVAPAELAHRIEAAPAGYVLAHTGSDIARHAELLEPLSSPGEVRVISTPDAEPGVWKLDLASRDRPGLLAVFTGVLVHESFDVARAVLATWDDGAALQALTIRATEAPDLVSLQRSLEWSLDQGLSAPPVDGATVTFDQTASSLYTSCEVVAPDRPGLLHAVAVAITNAGADIHAASVATVDGVARDRFDLSTADHHKLGRNVERAIADNLRQGFSGLVRQ